MFARALVNSSGYDFDLTVTNRLHPFGHDRGFRDILKQRGHRFMLLSSPELSSPGCADKLLEKGSGDDEFSGRGRAGACPEELHRVTGVMFRGSVVPRSKSVFLLETRCSFGLQIRLYFCAQSLYSGEIRAAYERVVKNRPG